MPTIASADFEETFELATDDPVRGPRSPRLSRFAYLPCPRISYPFLSLRRSLCAPPAQCLAAVGLAP